MFLGRPFLSDTSDASDNELRGLLQILSSFWEPHFTPGTDKRPSPPRIKVFPQAIMDYGEFTEVSEVSLQLQDFAVSKLLWDSRYFLNTCGSSKFFFFFGLAG